MLASLALISDPLDLAARLSTPLSSRQVFFSHQQKRNPPRTTMPQSQQNYFSIVYSQQAQVINPFTSHYMLVGCIGRQTYYLL